MRRWIGVVLVGLLMAGCGGNAESDQNQDTSTDTTPNAESATESAAPKDSESPFAENCRKLKTAINETGVGEGEHPSQYDYTQFAKWFEGNSRELGQVPADEMPQYKGESLLNVLYRAAIDKANENKPGLDNSAQTKIQNDHEWDDALDEIYSVCDNIGVPLT